MQMQTELCSPTSVLGVKVKEGSEEELLCKSCADLSVVREELLLEEFPSIPWFPAGSRCLMPTRLTVVVSLKHQRAAPRQL